MNGLRGWYCASCKQWLHNYAQRMHRHGDGGCPESFKPLVEQRISYYRARVEAGLPLFEDSPDEALLLPCSSLATSAD